MKKIESVICLILVLFLNLGLGLFVYSETITGNVEKSERKLRNKVIDADTKSPIPFADVRIPSKGIKTTSDENGYFELNADITGSAIMSVEKQGYRPFSVTIDKNDFSKPLIIGIEKTKMNDLSLESNVIHIGDNKFSQNSANSGDFKVRSAGAFYSKKFVLKSPNGGERVYFAIGSVIGVDTLLAKQMGQSNVSGVYASPAQIYFNGQKIGEIKFNSDGQQILLPKELIRGNAENEITVKAGKNLFQKNYIDYDDIELANIHIEYKNVVAKE